MRKKKILTKSEQMARVRTKGTDVELALRKKLWALGLRYKLNSSLPGKPDLIFLKRKIAIFVDGCFWHGCPKHYRQPKNNDEFWRAKIQRNQERDRLVTQTLEEMNWTVIRFWEHEIENNLGACISRVMRVVA
jgi:DNA mismatch endonuclease (patch repair protein)